MNKIKEIFSRHELISNLVIRNLKVRYKNSALGFFWTLLNPLFMIAIYMIFIKLMKFAIDVPSLVTGVLAWQFLVMCLSDCVEAIAGNSTLVKKTYFPRAILPFSTVTANLINFILSLFVLVFVLIIVKGINISTDLFYLPLLVILHYFLCLGAGFIISCAQVYFKDTEHLISVFLMAWFFLTPVIYPLQMIADSVSASSKIPDICFKIYLLNPMTALVMLYRKVLLGGSVENFNVFLISLSLCVVIIVLGYYIFSKFEPYFSDEL